MKALVIFLSIMSFIIASPLKEGVVYETLTVQDQFEKSYPIENVNYILFSGDKASGKIGHEAFVSLSKDDREAKKIVYISDMSGVPSLVYSFFMESKFKEYPYRLGLIWDENIALKFPKKENEATLIGLADGVVKSVEYFDSVDKLKERLTSL